MLVWKLRGHCAYYGITGNASNLTTFCFHAVSHLAEVAEPSISKEVDAVEAVSPRHRPYPAFFK
jgi:hypothetical protein